MNYSLEIRQANIQAHLDIEREIANKKDGQMTFTLRINGGNVADVVMVEYIDVQPYVRDFKNLPKG